ncbi:DUF6286 domain-containing protein [Actinorugispora endophytica]|uniref:DUF6286 domain-containing protein n=1 Tax=Actinorugispora endophytica TaxID=1605990 RepID=A0A4R6UIB3_9ACTN|nr:DUF6286 domain-containing protein [Actinorugispora endophytica]TDQ46618.1 hypothetical protein EV190_12455 [Actinorugispora endophytica]
MTTVEEALGRPDQVSAERTGGATVHTFRPCRSWRVLGAGAVLVAVAGVAAAEVIAALAGSSLSPLSFDGVSEHASTARWSDPAVRVASGVLALIGLVLISLALVPGRGYRRTLRVGDPVFAGNLSEAVLIRELAVAACGVEGVRDARVALGRRRVRVRVGVGPEPCGALPSLVRAAVEQRGAELALADELKVRVRVRRA